MWIRTAGFAGALAALCFGCGKSGSAENRANDSIGGSAGTGGGAPTLCGAANAQCSSDQTCQESLFRDFESIPALDSFAGRVLAGELNGDAYDDLVVLGILAGPGVLIGRGSGAFDPMRLVPTEREPGVGNLADFNGDGTLDLAVSIGPLSSGLMLGNGDGTFRTESLFDQEATMEVAPADVNGDGFMDVAVVRLQIQLRFGKGDGTFAEPIAVPAGISPLTLRFDDLNGDSRPDMIVTNYMTPEVSVVQNNGDGSFAPPREVPSGGVMPTKVATGDLDGNGSLDLVVVHEIDASVAVVLGAASGEFSSPQSFATGPNPTNLVVVDVNDDGALDIATANRDPNHGPSTVSVLLGKGDGTFAPHRVFGVGVSASYVTAADLDQDGRPDLVVTDSLSNNLSVLFSDADSACVP